MSQAYLTSIIEERWLEAVANPTIPRWRTLAMMAAQIADAVADNDPDSLMVITHRAVYESAYTRMLSLMPKQDASQ